MIHFEPKSDISKKELCKNQPVYSSINKIDNVSYELSDNSQGIQWQDDGMKFSQLAKLWGLFIIRDIPGKRWKAAARQQTLSVYWGLCHL